ncbi:MAG: hypothetical protein ABFC96_17335 [Thermoguttaceae bacterium]
MNLVGKIFTVLIFVLCLVFMTLSMAVYATHRNWRDEFTRPRGAGKEPGLQIQLTEAKAENETLKKERDDAKKQLDLEKSEKAQALTKLQTAYAVKENDLRELEKGHAQLQKDSREAVKAMQETQTNSGTYYQELEKQRTATIEAQQDRDKLFKDLVQKDDELNQARNDLEQLRNRSIELAKDLAKYKDVNRWVGAPSPDSPYQVKAPPRVEGNVMAVRGQNLIEISIGSDQGIRKGHQLQVYRKGTYVGRVEVVKVAATSAVCKVDPLYQNSNVVEGDRVASRIE